MADGRMRLSGSEYRKRQEEKHRKEQEVLENTKRIDSFFSKCNSQPPTDIDDASEPPQSTLTESLTPPVEAQDLQGEGGEDNNLASCSRKKDRPSVRKRASVIGRTLEIVSRYTNARCSTRIRSSLGGASKEIRQCGQRCCELPLV